VPTKKSKNSEPKKEKNGSKKTALPKKNDAAPDKKNKECENCFLIDKIDAVIFGEEGVEIVTKSEVDRPGLEGGARTLDGVVLERLMYLDAKKYKMLPSEEDVDKHLEGLQRENNLSQDDVKKKFMYLVIPMKRAVSSWALCLP
jgi:hypothetical protein